MNNDNPITQVGGNHYNNPIQPWDIIMDHNYPWCVGEILKYLCRHPFKGGKQDLLKAISIAHKASVTHFVWHPKFEDYPSIDYLSQYNDMYTSGSVFYFTEAIRNMFLNDWSGVIRDIYQIIDILYGQETPTSD